MVPHQSDVGALENKLNTLENKFLNKLNNKLDDLIDEKLNRINMNVTTLNTKHRENLTLSLKYHENQDSFHKLKQELTLLKQEFKNEKQSIHMKLQQISTDKDGIHNP